MKKLLKKMLPLKFRLALINCFFKICIFFFSLFPLKNRVLFYSIRSDDKLLDNSKTLYDALDCDKIFFTKKLPHPLMTQLKACFMLSTSRVIVTDDYCRYMRIMRLRKKQRMFQIWHGCGAFKRFGLDAPSKLTREQEIRTHSAYSAVAVTSEMCRRYFAGAFGVSEEICLPVGLPKTDKEVNQSETIKKEFFSRHPELEGKRIYLYCPTFREKDGTVIEFDPGIDWKALSDSLEEDEVFIVSRHPIINYELVKGEYENITDMTEESTVSLVAGASVLITDYSSTVHDAVLMGVPVVFYCPDYKVYERSFYLNFPDDLPGEMIDNACMLPDAMRRAEKEPPVDRIERFRNEQLSACDGHSTEKIKAVIMDWLK